MTIIDDLQKIQQQREQTQDGPGTTSHSDNAKRGISYEVEIVDPREEPDESSEVFWADPIGGQPWIETDTVTVVSAPPGRGKTSFSRYLGAMCSIGNLGGIYQGEPLPVLYVMAEEKAAKLTDPMTAIGANMDNVKAVRLIKTEADGRTKRVHLCLPKDLPRLEAVIEQTGAKLVVIDPLAAVLKGSNKDLNSSTDMRDLFDDLIGVAENHHVNIVVVAHAKKGATVTSERTSGSTQIQASARSEIQLEFHPDNSKGTGRTDLIIECTKINEYMQPTSLRGHMEEVATPAGRTTRKFIIDGYSDVSIDMATKALQNGTPSIDRELTEALIVMARGGGKATTADFDAVLPPDKNRNRARKLKRVASKSGGSSRTLWTIKPEYEQLGLSLLAQRNSETESTCPAPA